MQVKDRIILFCSSISLLHVKVISDFSQYGIIADKLKLIHTLGPIEVDKWSQHLTDTANSKLHRHILLSFEEGL